MLNHSSSKILSYIALLVIFFTISETASAEELPDVIPTGLTCEKNVLSPSYGPDEKLATFTRNNIEYTFDSCITESSCNTMPLSQKENEMNYGGSFSYLCTLTIQNIGGDLANDSWVSVGFDHGSEKALSGEVNTGFPLPNGLKKGESSSLNKYTFQVAPQEVRGGSVTLVTHLNTVVESTYTSRTRYLSKFYPIARALSGADKESPKLQEQNYTNNTLISSIPVEQIPFPGAVDAVTYKKINDQTVRATWLPVPGALSYRIYGFSGAGEVFASGQTSQTTTTSIDLPMPLDKAPLTVYVQAINNYGAGPQMSQEYTYYKPLQIFKDVPEVEWYKDYVLEAYYTGAVSGYKTSDGTPLHLFGPGDNITVAEFAKIMVSLNGIPVPDEINLVPEEYKNHWGAPLLNMLIKENNEIVRMDKNPNRRATRADIVRFIMEKRYEISGTLLQAIKSPEGAKLMKYTFLDVTDENKVFVQLAYDFGIVDGYSDGTFKPSKLVNRAEMTKILKLARADIVR